MQSLPSPENNPEVYLTPDAPLEALMSLSGNPLLKDMSTDQLRDLLAHVKKLSQQPASLSAAVAKEAGARKSSSAAAERKAKLDLL